jgi:hypothetical protein
MRRGAIDSVAGRCLNPAPATRKSPAQAGFFVDRNVARFWLWFWVKLWVKFLQGFESRERRASDQQSGDSAADQPLHETEGRPGVRVGGAANEQRLIDRAGELRRQRTGSWRRVARTLSPWLIAVAGLAREPSPHLCSSGGEMPRVWGWCAWPHVRDQTEVPQTPEQDGDVAAVSDAARLGELAVGCPRLGGHRVD